MNTNELNTAFAAAADEPVADPTGQLLLLPTERRLSESNEPARFRLSKATRERGLRHVAEIRAQLASSKSAGTGNANVVSLPPRREPAA